MTDTQYLAPSTLDEAISAYAAADGTGRILAGGTDLLVQMQAGMVEPGLIVDIKNIAELTSIEGTAEGGFVVGAAVSGAALEKHTGFAEAWPGVLEGLNLIGSTQIQGRASLGGNLCNGSPAADSVPAMVAAGAVLTVQGPDGRREIAVEDAAKALIGSKLDDGALDAAAAACSAACNPIDDKRGTIDYRTRVAGVLLKRTAAIAAERATQA